MDWILIDTESTHLRGVSALDLNFQPHIVELSATKVDSKTLDVKSHMTFLCKPPIALPKDFIRITGITDQEIAKQPPFAKFYPEVVDFFLGARALVAHNEPYDRGVLVSEVTRLDRVTSFPWPPERICTAELSSGIAGKSLKMRRLLAYIKDPKNWDPKDEVEQTHRANEDVDQLLEVVRWMREKKKWL